MSGVRSPITCKGREGAAGFYAQHFSVSWAFDCGAISLRRRFTFAISKGGQFPIMAWLTVGCLGNRPGLPDCESGVFATTISDPLATIPVSKYGRVTAFGVRIRSHYADKTTQRYGTQRGHKWNRDCSKEYLTTQKSIGVSRLFYAGTIV